MGHGQDPAEGSLEARVRKYLPKDYQIVMAMLGAYATIFAFFKLKPSKKEEEVVLCMWCCVTVVMMPLHSLSRASLLLLRFV
ncbi:hypothetical protein PsorP6_014063 [Peronosclerospora sorghi]|uniref:Uncharacterized protein n=1 Tax=Peronosclerospora sorghi TaxID=230839 RepID=A0ACC0VIF5_9STRA|nr:hypothetical protein PsorP6_014063 [Peronosclerospora sorghi]